MAVFKYTAVTPDGQRVKASVEGISLTSVENDLIRANLTVVKIREKKGLAQIEVSPERVPRQEVMHFSRQVAAFADQHHADDEAGQKAVKPHLLTPEGDV